MLKAFLIHRIFVISQVESLCFNDYQINLEMVLMHNQIVNFHFKNRINQELSLLIILLILPVNEFRQINKYFCFMTLNSFKFVIQISYFKHFSNNYQRFLFLYLKLLILLDSIPSYKLFQPNLSQLNFLLIHYFYYKNILCF